MKTIYLKIEDDDIVIVDGDMEIVRCDFKTDPWDVADAILAYFHHQELIEYIIDENESEEANPELEQEKLYNFQLDERLNLIENHLSEQVELIGNHLKEVIRTEMVILENALKSLWTK